MNKLKILFFADTHLGFDYPLKVNTINPHYGEEFFRNYQYILNFAVKEKVDLVIHGGDFFFRSKVPQPIIDRAYSILFEFADNNIPFYLVPGNHERSVMPTSVFLNHPNIFIFDEPKNYTYQKNGFNLTLTGFPCERNQIRENFLPMLQAVRKDEDEGSFKIMIMHQAIEGAKVEKYTFKHGADILPMEQLPGDYQLILSGHIHKAQTLWKKLPPNGIPVVYSGSVERTSFQEMKEDKSFNLITLVQDDTNKTTYEKISLIKLPARPMTEIVLHNSMALEEILPYITKKSIDYPANAIIKIRYDKTSAYDKKRLKNIAKMLKANVLRAIFAENQIVEIGSELRTYKIRLEEDV